MNKQTIGKKRALCLVENTYQRVMQQVQALQQKENEQQKQKQQINVATVAQLKPEQQEKASVLILIEKDLNSTENWTQKVSARENE